MFSLRLTLSPRCVLVDSFRSSRYGYGPDRGQGARLNVSPLLSDRGSRGLPTRHTAALSSVMGSFASHPPAHAARRELVLKAVIGRPVGLQWGGLLLLAYAAEIVILLGAHRGCYPGPHGTAQARPGDPGNGRASGLAMRARYPDTDGYVSRDGIKVYYEVYENEAPTILLMPTWSLVQSRHWKMQVPYLSRHYRVVTFDGRGNGKSDRPVDPDQHRLDEYLADALAVLDKTGTAEAFVAGVPRGGYLSADSAARFPDRKLGLNAFGPVEALRSVPELTHPAGAESPGTRS